MVNSTMIIGLIGNIGAGKSTCAQVLVEQGFTEMTFADPLKQACMALFGFTHEQMYGSQEMKATPDPRWFGVTPRQIMQFVGTDLLRNQLAQIMPEIGTDIFVHRMKVALTEHQGNVVVSDVRFQNEADLIKSLGGYLIKIVRPGKASDNHASEQVDLVTGYDITLLNYGTKEEFLEKCKGLYEYCRPQMT